MMIVLIGCLIVTVTREGVQKSKHVADVICAWLQRGTEAGRAFRAMERERDERSSHVAVRPTVTPLGAKSHVRPHSVSNEGDQNRFQNQKLPSTRMLTAE